MTPAPGPRPFAAIGCFACGVIGLFSFVVLGPAVSEKIYLPLFVTLLLALVLVLLRILARRTDHDG